MKKIFLLLGTIIFITANMAFAKSDGGFYLARFKASAIEYIQKDGNCFTGLLNWNPGFGFGGFDIKLNIGATMIKTKIGDKQPLLEYGALGELHFSDGFSIEAGGGIVNFVSNGGSRYSAMANGVFDLKKSLPLLDTFVVGYQAIFVPTLLTHGFRAGFGINF